MLDCKLLKPAQALREIESLGVRRGYVAMLAEVNVGAFSQFLNGQRVLSRYAQLELLNVLDFLRKARASTDLPLDLRHDFPAIVKAYSRFCAKQNADAEAQNAEAAPVSVEA